MVLGAVRDISRGYRMHPSVVRVLSRPELVSETGGIEHDSLDAHNGAECILF